jgi:hypothetical protein
MASAIEQDTSAGNGSTGGTALQPFVSTPTAHTETDSHGRRRSSSGR